MQLLVDSLVEEAWKCWTTPANIQHLTSPNDERSVLCQDEAFDFSENSKNGSIRTDFDGQNDQSIESQLVNYNIRNDRERKIQYSLRREGTFVKDIFDCEK